ncbi:hypothetical protein, variant [Exophiala mesophila]|uniref:Methyltransferase domain-containing protein n=1 Tax=Exophiala mesophila TaxID=212818 RepID=A0A0D1ZD24_EXOME|nr:hypothetical protein, variant [Exophiala mesophila]KIV92562.1 hypothetical protein, variant [Exophiala mesophila]
MTTTPPQREVISPVLSPWQDSSYGSPNRPESTEPVEDISDYELHGRKYSVLSSRPLPVDENELIHQKLLDALFKLALDRKNYLCPQDIHKARVLDLNSRLGDWCLAVGDLDDTCEIIGVDIAPIQPMWVAPTVRFEIDDIDDNWTWGNRFHLIFARQLTYTRNLLKLVSQCYNQLEPGGWLEFQQLSVEPHVGSPSRDRDDERLRDPKDEHLGNPEDMLPTLKMAISELNHQLVKAEDIECVLQAQGFQNVKHTTIEIPFGSWPEDERKVRHLSRAYL